MKKERAANAGPHDTKTGLAEHLLHFLSGLGQRSEAELYLRTYRALPPGRFAMILPTPGVLSDYCGSFSEQLKFLTELGLFPTVVVGALMEVSDSLVEDLRLSLREIGVDSRLGDAPCVGPFQKRAWIDIVRMNPDNDDRLSHITSKVAPRKTLFLRRAGGLGVGLNSRIELSPGHFLPTSEMGISTISLRNDSAELRGLGVLSKTDERCLAGCQSILEAPGADPKATVSVASPLSILRELFTVRGAGTLVKLGSVVSCYSSFAGLDQERLRSLIEQSFGRKAKDQLFLRKPLRIYLEAEYRGMALLEPGCGAPFLSKFAVLPIAQGEGLGQDLWWSMAKETPRFYLRARPNNPIVTWYATVCDGMHRAGEWNVYWKGIAPDAIAEVIADALSRPQDFEASAQRS